MQQKNPRFRAEGIAEYPCLSGEAMANPEPQLVLASASPRRLKLLSDIGIVPDSIDPAEIDEAPMKMEGRLEQPRHYALRMAREKAKTVASRHPGALILAADTVVAVGRRILGKPGNETEARAFLELLSGRRHDVMTSLALVVPGRPECLDRVVASSVKLARLTRADIDFYIATGEWKDKAGGYAIQGQAARYVVRMEGSYTAIVGLPVREVSAMLAGAGYPAATADGAGA